MRTRYPDLEAQLNLEFQPVRNASPAHFTPAQIEQYNSRGYIDPIPLFAGEELRALQRHFLEENRNLTELSVHMNDPVVYDLVTHPRTTGYLQDLMGPNVVCHIAQFINKPPQQTKGGNHHQDATFNAMDARCTIVWLALEDADVENGCMWFVPGSHLRGVVECDRGHYVVNPLQYGAEQPCPVRAGHAIFLCDLVFHSSPANRSASRSRPAYTSSYAPAEVKPYKDANRFAVLCSGKDVHGHWKPHGRPQSAATAGMQK